MFLPPCTRLRRPQPLRLPPPLPAFPWPITPAPSRLDAAMAVTPQPAASPAGARVEAGASHIPANFTADVYAARAAQAKGFGSN